MLHLKNSHKSQLIKAKHCAHFRVNPLLNRNLHWIAIWSCKHLHWICKWCMYRDLWLAVLICFPWLNACSFHLIWHRRTTWLKMEGIIVWYFINWKCNEILLSFVTFFTFYYKKQNNYYKKFYNYDILLQGFQNRIPGIPKNPWILFWGILGGIFETFLWIYVNTIKKFLKTSIFW